VLYQVADCNTNVQEHKELISHWIIMCLDNFVQLVALSREKQALWTLTCLLLIGCRHPMRNILLKDILYGDLTLPLIYDIFVFAGIDYFRNRKGDEKARSDFIRALSKMEVPFEYLAVKCTSLAINNEHKGE